MIQRALGMFSVALFLAAFPQSGRAQGDSREQWTRTVEAAKKEGGLVIHAGPANERIYQNFQEKYPEIKVTYITGRGSERVSRIMAERRAGKFLVDLYFGGKEPLYSAFYKGGILSPVKPILILPEVLDLPKWWGGRHTYLDDERRYILSFNGVTQSYFQYNSKLVDPNEFRSYWDFLNPKWKGKMVSWEPMAAGTDGALRFLYHHPEIGPPFVRRFLTELDLTTTRDPRQFVDWLATGKFSLAALQSPERSNVYGAKNQGLPVNWFDSRAFKEGAPLSTSSGNVVVINRAPHPNAAKVFVNWLLTREGQITYQKVSGDTDSLRIDIPKDEVPSHVRRTADVKYALLTDPAYEDSAPVNQLVNEVWKKRK